MSVNIIVIDYDIGNVRSIMNAFRQIGVEPRLSRERDEILQADGVVLPGVGAFAQGMENLNRYCLPEIIDQYVQQDKPLLGICLGMQLMLEESEEFGLTKGLGLIGGRVVKLPVQDPEHEKLPHVCWNEIQRPLGISWDNSILDGIDVGEDMYFVHSFVAQPEDEGNILSATMYSKYRFVSSIRDNNLYGCQFHPEKSGREGLMIINNFIEICDKND